MNLAELWNFQQADMEADKFANDMKQSEKRKLLLKNTELLKEQQARFAKIEADIAAMSERIQKLQAETERLNGLFTELTAKLGKVEDMSEEEVSGNLKTAEKLMAAIETCEKELKRLCKEADTADRSQIEIKRAAAKTKAEYDATKKEYDVEFASDKIKLKKMRDEADKRAAKLDPADLERYRQIKQHCVPVIARLVNDQCTGCFMTLPIGTLRDIKASQEAHVCDNCGRLLYPAE